MRPEPVRSGGYNPLQTLTPSTWFPILGQDEWGQNVTIYSFWQDVLRQPNLTLFGGYGFFSQRLNYGFRYLNNHWRFIPHPQGTQLEFFVDFEFRSRLLQAVIGTVFNEAVRLMVRAFERRAMQLYGRPAAAAAPVPAPSR